MQAEESIAHARRIPWKWIGAGALLLALIVAGRTLPFDQWLQAFNAWISKLGPTGILVFAAGYAAGAVLFLPGSVLTVGAGFVFGLLWGTVAVSIGSTSGAALAFLISRYVARENVSGLARKNQKFAAIDSAIGNHGWKIVLLLRLSPLIPFNVSNYLYGLTAVPFWPYVAASWLGMLPGTLLYVYIGAAGRAGLQAAGRQTSGSPLQTVFLLVGLLATITVTWYVSRIARKALQETTMGEELK